MIFKVDRDACEFEESPRSAVMLRLLNAFVVLQRPRFQCLERSFNSNALQEQRCWKN
jgi:hypothetical protein